MSIPVMIMGSSGAGKSSSLRNLDPAKCYLIQTVNKPLPFRSDKWKPCTNANPSGSILSTDSSAKMVSIIQQAESKGREIVIIDDYQYLLANEFMRRSDEKGFDKFTDIGRHAWDVIIAAQSAAPSLRVYFLSHTDTDDFGNTKVKTIGKLLDDKICLEGLFTIVLKATVNDGRHSFTTQNSGRDTVKAPMDMFATSEIDNDLNAVDRVICEYYGINQQENAA